MPAMGRSSPVSPWIRAAAGLLLLLGAGFQAPGRPVPPGDDEPAAPPASADSPAPARVPLDPRRLATLLSRAETNLRLHGLTLDPRYLRNAAEDYLAVHSGMAGEKALEGMSPEAWNDARFTAAFALAFCLAREDLPTAPEERNAVVSLMQDCLSVAATLSPEASALWIVDGMAREKGGDHEGAVRNLDRGLDALDDENGLAPWQRFQLRLFGLLARGRAHIDGGGSRAHLALDDFTAAGALAARALQSPEMPRGGSRLNIFVLTHRAAALQRLDQYAEAEATLDTLMKDDPGNALHPYNRGLVAAWQQKFGEALDYYRRAAALDKNSPAPHIKTAYILLAYHPGAPRPEIAAALEEAAIYRNLVGGETDEYLACRGEAALLAGDGEAAERWFEKALALNPRCSKALQRMVRILGSEADRSPEREKLLQEFNRRLTEVIRMKQSGEGMETARPEITFC